MIDIGAIVGVAGSLLFRFLDSRDRELSKKKIELEIEDLLCHRDGIKAENAKQAAEIRKEVFKQLQVIVQEVPGLQWASSRLPLHPVVVRYAPIEPNPQEIVARLRQVIKERTTIGAGDAAQVVPAPAGPLAIEQAPLGLPIHNPTSPDPSAESAQLDVPVAPVDPTQVEPAPAGPLAHDPTSPNPSADCAQADTSPAPILSPTTTAEGLRRLHQRIEEQRQ